MTCENCIFLVGVCYRSGFCDKHIKSCYTDSKACQDYTAKLVPQPTIEPEVFCQEQEVVVEVQEPTTPQEPQPITPTRRQRKPYKPRKKSTKPYSNSLLARLTEDDILYIKQNYGKLTLQQIGEHFGVTGHCINRNLDKLGIKKLPTGITSTVGKYNQQRGLKNRFASSSEAYQYYLAHQKEIDEYINQHKPLQQ